MNSKVILGAVAVIAIAGGAWFFTSGKSGEAQAETASASEAPADHIADRVLGDENAPVTVIEYASLTCPHCDNFHSQVAPSLRSEYVETGKVKFIFREVYFDGPGLLAASLARCVPADKYYPMIDTLYDTDDNWLRGQETVEGVIEGLRKIGVLAGLSNDAINACLDDRAKQEEMVAHSTANTSKDGVTGTPTLFVNGKKVEKWGWETLKAEIDKALK